MVHFFSSFALVLATGLGTSPGDPVGIGDARVEMDLGPRQISVDGARWEALRAMAAYEEELPKAPGPWAAHRQVRIERNAEGLRVHATWRLESREAGWWTGPLVGPRTGLRVESATWRGRDIGITATPAGQEVALKMKAKRRGELKLVAFVPADQIPGGVDGNFDLWLMPAVTGELRIDSTRKSAPVPEGRVAEIVADGQARRAIDGRFWTAEAQLGLKWVDASQPTDRVEGPLAVAQSAMGLTFGDGELRGRARVSWLLRRGQLDRVSIDSAGLGRDLEVVGPNVHKWTRNGNRIDIELKEAVEGRVDVDLRWTQGVPTGAEASLAAPRLTPQQAYRTESFMQLARDGELEILPKLSGWSAVARAELPEWAGGYIQGTATATFRSEGSGSGSSFALLRYVPVSGPPVVVDVAAYEVATTDEGRNLVQARYDVRNERASHLRVQLPKGSRMLGVRVNGETVTPSLDANSAGGSRSAAGSKTEAWRIPIVRSLESVKGTLSFPVEIIFISEADAWEKKEARDLQLPALDAPVAVSRVRVYLPPKYDNRVDKGDFHRVNDFSEGDGITYGLGVGAGSAEVGRADELYREALSGWMSNDFRRAQSSLDELQALGASSANIDGLQANLDLVQGRGEGKDGGSGQAAVVSRRIKDQANMRAADDKIALAEKAEEAKALEAQGQYDQAEAKLAEAQELGNRLAMLEQSESQEQAVYNQGLSSSSARVAEKKKRKVSRESDAKKGSSRRKKAKKNKSGKRWGSKSDKASNAVAGQAAPASAGGGGDYDFEFADEDQGGRPVYILEGANVNDESRGTVADRDGRYQRKVQVGRNLPATGVATEAPDMPVEPADVMVYDFEDDDISGELLVPEGAALARPMNGAADAPAAGPMGGELPPPPPPEPVPEPEPVLDAVPGVVVTTEPTSQSISLEQAKSIPVGNDTSRDFTAVVELTPTASRDSAGISLAGTTGAETKMVLDDAPAPRSSRRSRRKPKPPKKARGRKRKEAAPAPPEEAAAAMPMAAAPDPNAALAGPVATASAVSVHIPAIGQEVLYQHMLLPEGKTLTVHLEARRQRKSKRKSK